MSEEIREKKYKFESKIKLPDMQEILDAASDFTPPSEKKLEVETVEQAKDKEKKSIMELAHKPVLSPEQEELQRLGMAVADEEIRRAKEKERQRAEELRRLCREREELAKKKEEEDQKAAAEEMKKAIQAAKEKRRPEKMLLLRKKRRKKRKRLNKSFLSMSRSTVWHIRIMDLRCRRSLLLSPRPLTRNLRKIRAVVLKRRQWWIFPSLPLIRLRTGRSRSALERRKRKSLKKPFSKMTIKSRWIFVKILPSP